MLRVLILMVMVSAAACSGPGLQSEIPYHPDVPERALDAMQVDGDPDHVYRPGEYVRLDVAVETMGSTLTTPVTHPVDGDPTNDLGYAKLHFYLLNKDEFDAAPDDSVLSTVYFVAVTPVPAAVDGVTSIALEFFIPLEVLESGPYILAGIVENPDTPFDQADRLYQRTNPPFSVTGTVIQIDASTPFHDHRLVTAETSDAGLIYVPDEPVVPADIHVEASFWGRAGYVPTTSDEGDRVGELQDVLIRVDAWVNDDWAPVALVQSSGALTTAARVTYDTVGATLPFDLAAEVSAAVIADALAAQGVTDPATLSSGDYAGALQFRVSLADPDGVEEDITDNNSVTYTVPIYLLQAPDALTAGGAPGFAPQATIFQPDYNNWTYTVDTFSLNVGKYLSAGNPGKLFGAVWGHQNLNVYGRSLQVDFGTGAEIGIYGVRLRLIAIDIDGGQLDGLGDLASCLTIISVRILCNDVDLPALDLDIPELKGSDLPDTPSTNQDTGLGDPEVREFNDAIAGSGALSQVSPFRYEKRKKFVDRTFTIGPVPLNVEAGAVARVGGGISYGMPQGLYYFAFNTPWGEAGLYALGGIGTSLLSGGVAVEGILGYISFDSVFSGELDDINNNALFDRYTELAFVMRVLRARLGLYLKQSWYALKWCKRVFIWYPCGVKKKSRYHHKWLYRTPYVYNATFPVFTEVDRSAVPPEYDTVSPQAVQVGFGSVDFVFAGKDFNRNVNVEVVDGWCSNPQDVPVAYQEIRYKKIVRCTPVASGSQQFRIYYDDGVLQGTPDATFTIDVTPAPVISDVALATSPMLYGDAQTITVTGEYLTSEIHIEGLSLCSPLVLQSGGTAAQRIFTCNVGNTGGEMPSIVNGSTVAPFAFDVPQVAVTSVSIVDLTPPIMNSPAAGDRVRLSFAGNNMLRNVIVYGTSVCEPGTFVQTVSSATLQEFECTAVTPPSGQVVYASFRYRLGNFTNTDDVTVYNALIQDVQPTRATVGVPVTYTISGSFLEPPSVYLPGCTDLTIGANPQAPGQYSLNWEFSCTLTAPGSYAGVVTSHASSVTFAVEGTLLIEASNVTPVSLDGCVSPPTWQLDLYGANLNSAVTMYTNAPGCEAPPLVTGTVSPNVLQFGGAGSCAAQAGAYSATISKGVQGVDVLAFTLPATCM